MRRSWMGPAALAAIVLQVIVLQMSTAGHAQSFPTRPITVIVAQPAGSAVDVITRVYTEAVSKALGQTIIVDNRPGGGGIIAAQNLKQSTPDGHTLLVIANGPLTIAPSLRSLPYDVSKDFDPVAVIFGFSQFMAVSATSPAQSIQDVIGLAKQKPEGLSYSTLGLGSITHLLCSLVAKHTGAAMQHVPYTSTSQYLLDLATGRVDFTFSSFQSTNALESEGKIKYLGTTAAVRSPLRPNVPTTAEAGFPELNLSVWFTLLAPSGTSAAVIEKLNGEFAKVARDPVIAERLLREGIDGTVASPSDTKARIASEAATMSKLIKEFDIKVN